KGRTGTTEGLAALGRTLGFGVDVVAPVGAHGATFSSSRIREHLRHGETREAADQLGYWWRVRGRVEPGAAKDSAFRRSTSGSPPAKRCATASTPCASTSTGAAIPPRAMWGRARP